MLRVVPKDTVQETPAAEPVATAVPERSFGTLEGKVEVTEDFDAPLDVVDAVPEPEPEPLAFAPTEPPPAADEEPILVVKKTRTCGIELPLDIHAILAARAKVQGTTLKQEALKALLIGVAR